MASNASDSNDMQSLTVKTENDLPSSSSANESNPSSPVPESAGAVGSTLNGLASDFFEDYTSTLPDPIIKYYLSSAGCESSDTKVIRLIALVAEKFIADIANDALQHCKMRGAGQSSKKATKDKRYVLSTEDLTPALADYGINGKKPHYFV